MINLLQPFGRFSLIPHRETSQVDPEIFSHLQLHIAAHPDIETSCVLANLFRAIYMGSSLFYAESLERLDATSRALAQDLLRAKLLKAFPQEEWDEAHRLISQLPPERGGIGLGEPSAAAATLAFAKSTVPSIGSRAWAKAWVEYFEWLTRRCAASAFAFAQHGGFEGFKYLWGAPAAAAVIGAFFGVVLLDEKLGLRNMIVSSPPVQWIADLVEIEKQAEPQPVIEAQVENVSIARLQPKASPKRILAKPDAPKVHDAAISAQSEHAAQDIGTQNQAVSEPATPTAFAASEGVPGRIAPPEFSPSQGRPTPTVFPREANRPDSQSRPRPIEQPAKSPVAVTPATDKVTPPAVVRKLPLVAAVSEKVQPVLGEVQSDLPKMPLLEELPPVINDVGSQGKESSAAPVEMAVQKLTPARGLEAAVGNEQAAASAFIQRLQSGGQIDPAPGGRPNERAERIESADRSGPSDRVERVDRSGPSERMERVEQRLGLARPERVERAEKVQRPEKLERIERVERVQRPERAEKFERPEKLERIERKLAERIERGLRPERR